MLVKDDAGNMVPSSNYTVTGNSGKEVGNYKLTITFKGKYTGKKSLAWKISAKESALKKVTLEKVSAGKKKLTIKWAKQKDVIGYRIQIATNKKFTKGVKTITVKGASKSSTTIKGLKTKKKYFIRICSYSKSQSSKWSAVKSKKTK